MSEQVGDRQTNSIVMKQNTITIYTRHRQTHNGKGIDIIVKQIECGVYERAVVAFMCVCVLVWAST